MSINQAYKDAFNEEVNKLSHFTLIFRKIRKLDVRNLESRVKLKFESDI